MKMTKKQYKKYAENKAKKSKLWLDMFNAFWVGGLICVIGQFFLEIYINLNFDKEIAGTLASITLIFISAFFINLHSTTD